MVSDKIVLGVAVVSSITVMETMALYLGHNGVLLTGAVAAVVGIVSFLYGRERYSSKKEVALKPK